MGFTREAYTKLLTEEKDFPTTPESEAAARKQFQDMFDNILTIVNSLKASLEKTASDPETGNLSATENIGGKAIETIKGSIAAGTLYSQLAAIKAIADAAKDGELYENAINDTGFLLDGVVTDAKLANDIKIGSLAALANFFPESYVVDGETIEPSIQLALNYIAAIIGSASLETTAQTITGAISEIVTKRALGTGEVVLDNLGSDIPKIKYGTLTNPPEETYPAGTIYVQYTE